MRISDWSSDVCSSDLHQAGASRCPRRTVAGIPRVQAGGRPFPGDIYVQRPIRNGDSPDRDECADRACRRLEIGRASWRERVCQYVLILEVPVPLKNRPSPTTQTILTTTLQLRIMTSIILDTQ